ncbi:MAG: efflux RND transporter periplasmic adaptor subunit [Clostridia bacterium]|nr:efflux RND transporter periplasmic adaptor subunit [Clostridia bacterium]MDQ7792430.1 efflux RND transporter periplasmic adaptor subunit [Clostridia bacterium]
MKTEPKTMRLVLAALILVLAVAGWFVWGKTHNPDRGVVLAATGSVEATEVRVIAEVGGLLEELLVAEGSTVEKGQELARLDSQQYLIQVQQSEAGVRAANAALAEAEAGARSQEIEAARQEAERLARQAGALESELALAADIQERFRLLHEQGGVSDQEFSEKETRYTVLENQFASATAAAKAARAKVRLLEAGTRDESLDRLSAQVGQAQAGVDAARLSLAKTVVTAPVTGTVRSLNYTAGELIRPGAEIVTLQVPDSLWIYTYVPQQRLSEVRLGGKVEVQPDSSAEEGYTGRVTYVSPQAEFTPRNLHTSEERAKLVFKVKVELENGFDRLKPGMSAEVFFIGD